VTQKEGYITHHPKLDSGAFLFVNLKFFSFFFTIATAFHFLAEILSQKRTKKPCRNKTDRATI